MEIFSPFSTEYEVLVTTADKFGAGTDANVYITVYGKKGVSKKLQLKDRSKNNFEAGDTDRFHVRVDNDTGPLTKIRCVFLSSPPPLPPSRVHIYMSEQNMSE